MIQKSQASTSSIRTDRGNVTRVRLLPPFSQLFLKTGERHITSIVQQAGARPESVPRSLTKLSKTNTAGKFTTIIVFTRR